MSKSITITDKDTEYTLEYNRDAVRRMEKAGFKVRDAGDTPMNDIPMLFSGAFLMHHPHVSESIKDALWERIPNKGDMVEALMVLYNEPLNALMDEPDKKSGEATWKMSE